LPEPSARLRRRSGAPVPVFAALAARAEQVEDLLADLVELEAEVHQHLRRDAVVLTQQAEQQVLGADVVVVEAAASSIAYSMTFLARGVWGSLPIVTISGPA
jgi:predicted secreted protein